MSSPALDAYSYLWDGTQPGWVLLKFEAAEAGFSIMNEDGPAILLVEDEKLHDAIVRKMMEAGVRIRHESTLTPAEVTVRPKETKR